MSVGGLAGSVRSVMDGKGIGTVLALLGGGVLGVLIVVSYFVNLDKH
ncbi:hypothetical protein [Streptomyces sp. NPDC001415]